MRRWKICHWIDGRRFALGPADGSVEDLSMVNGWWVSCNMVGGSVVIWLVGQRSQDGGFVIRPLVQLLYCIKI